MPLLTINILHFYTGQKRKMQKLTKNVTENVKTEIPKITFVVPRFFATEKKEVKNSKTQLVWRMRQSQCDQIGRFLKSFWCPFFVQIFGDLSGSPGLVVMAGDSFSEGRGFESQHRKLDGRFHKYFALKRKWTKKRPGVAHFKIFGDFWWYFIMSKIA